MTKQIPSVVMKNLKAGVRDQIEACGSGVAAARAAGLSNGMVSNYGSVHHPDKWPTMGTVYSWSEYSGETPLLEALADELSCVVVPVHREGAADVTVNMSLAFEKISKVAAEHAKAIADGQITADEADRIAKYCDEAKRRLALMSYQLRHDPRYRTVVTSSGVTLVAE